MLKNRTMGLLFAATFCLLAVCLCAQDRQPVFYFGGQPGIRRYAPVGRSCGPFGVQGFRPRHGNKNSWQPTPAKCLGSLWFRRMNATEAKPTPIAERRSSPRLLGTIFFEERKVVSVTRALGDEDYAPWSDDAVGFARDLYRALAPAEGESDTTVHLTVRHERRCLGFL